MRFNLIIISFISTLSFAYGQMEILVDNSSRKIPKSLKDKLELRDSENLREINVQNVNATGEKVDSSIFLWLSEIDIINGYHMKVMISNKMPSNERIINRAETVKFFRGLKSNCKLSNKILLDNGKIAFLITYELDYKLSYRSVYMFVLDKDENVTSISRVSYISRGHEPQTCRRTILKGSRIINESCFKNDGFDKKRYRIDKFGKIK